MNSQTLAAEAADWKNSSSGTRWERFRDSGHLDSQVNFADSPFARWPLQITALLGVCVIVAASFLMGPLHHPSRIVTAEGERRNVTLADGSVLALSAESDARIAFTSGERRVILARGEAHLNVAGDSGRPFFVSTPQVTVRAAGTALSVNASPRRTDITVLDGRAAVLAPLLDADPRKQTAPPQWMSKGERASVDRMGEVVIQHRVSAASGS